MISKFHAIFFVISALDVQSIPASVLAGCGSCFSFLKKSELRGAKKLEEYSTESSASTQSGTGISSVEETETTPTVIDFSAYQEVLDSFLNHNLFQDRQLGDHRRREITTLLRRLAKNPEQAPRALQLLEEIAQKFKENDIDVVRRMMHRVFGMQKSRVTSVHLPRNMERAFNFVLTGEEEQLSPAELISVYLESAQGEIRQKAVEIIIDDLLFVRRKERLEPRKALDNFLNALPIESPLAEEANKLLNTIGELLEKNEENVRSKMDDCLILYKENFAERNPIEDLYHILNDYLESIL